MIAVFDIALSGAQAAVRRLEVSAANVANVRTGAEASADGQPGPALYRPQRVEQVSRAGGGVSAETKPVEPGYSLVPDLDGGLAAIPNVNLVHEAVEQRLALRAYQANLSVIRTADEVQKSLLDATV